MTKRIRLIVALILALLVGMASRAAEEAKYEIEKSYADFEVRQYAPYLVAEVEVKGTFGTAAFQAFQALFKYIDGNNVSREQIAMTAPVSQRGGEKIAMTAPVRQERGSGDYVVGFVMPAGYTMETIPEPLDPKVKIREVPAQRMAAIRYSGSWGKRAYDKNLALLLGGLKREGITAAGDPVFARYNHPGVWPGGRRNEILVPLE